jgi:hypothetical protein
MTWTSSLAARQWLLPSRSTKAEVSLCRKSYLKYRNALEEFTIMK